MKKHDDENDNERARWLTWSCVALVSTVLAVVVWLGANGDYAERPAPNHDPAFRTPAWHPGDEGVIDTRGHQQ